MSQPNANDPFALMRQFWEKAAADAGQNPFMPPLTEEEIEKKITELKVIETWLTMSMGTLNLQIKALEMQKSALQAFKPKKD